MNRNPSMWTLIWTHAVLVLAAIVVLYPVLWVLKLALTPAQSFAAGISPFPDTASFENFATVLGSTDKTGAWLFGRQLFNSIIVAVATSVIGVVLACTAGYALSRWGFPGRDEALGLLLVTQMFPGVVMLIPLYILLDTLGLLDALTGLALVYATTAVPFCAWNLKSTFDTIPIEIEEAALLDGATRWTTFRLVILPLARPAIAVTALFSFMTAWNEFILAATLLGSERAYTLPVVLQSYVGDYGTEWGLFAAGAIVVSLPVMLLFYVLQRHLVEGLVAGSVKG